jgi:hypothetical protein
MLATNVFHALGLHMHQPPGNLSLLIETNPWEAEQIVRCYERPTRYARQYADVGHLHIGFSGILLEQFLDRDIVDRYRHILDIPAMLDAYRNTPNIELIGMGYFHPIFPLIPAEDWEEQLRTGRELMAEVFGRTPRGFWPPEMAFSMEMIPALVRAGYEYVVVDGVHVHPEDGVNDVFRPYLACQDGDCITVVPRDRDVSNAQESGLDATWFAHEVTHRCRFSPRPDEPRLCTTWSDGENGGWFRQTHEGSGFFGHYFSPYMEHVRGGEYPIRPVALSDYLDAHPAGAHAHVQTGAWNVGSASGFDLSQWSGSEGQRRGAETVRELSRRWWALRDAGKVPTEDLAQARRLLLEAQTSCYLFWGDDWLPKLAELTDAAAARIDAMEQAAAGKAAAEPSPAGPVHGADMDHGAQASAANAEPSPDGYEGANAAPSTTKPTSTAAEQDSRAGGFETSSTQAAAESDRTKSSVGASVGPGAVQGAPAAKATEPDAATKAKGGKPASASFVRAEVGEADEDSAVKKRAKTKATKKKPGSRR